MEVRSRQDAKSVCIKRRHEDMSAGEVLEEDCFVCYVKAVALIGLRGRGRGGKRRRGGRSLVEAALSKIEFVCLVSSEAKTVRGSNSIMNGKDVVEAIKRLGLEAYLEGAEEVAAADAEKVHAKRKRKKKPKQSKEEQEAAAIKQRELLQATAESFYSERGL
eukprot:jgi/Undpi1/14028/HiC_scaffold_9.g03679.m1